MYSRFVKFLLIGKCCHEKNSFHFKNGYSLSLTETVSKQNKCIQNLEIEMSVMNIMYVTYITST